MPSAIQLYDKLLAAPDDKTRARLIAEAFERLEERYPPIADLATQASVKETELRLLKEIETVRKEMREMEGKLRLEIEGVRKEIREVESGLRLEIEGVRKEMREMEGKLRLEIEGVRKEIETVHKEIAVLKTDLIKWIIGLLIAQTGILIAVFGGIARLMVSR
jgi:predicted  nucleic acid-binding Zn-ribbon protein